MNFKHLEYFLTVAEEKNFSRAAERLYISQQSLSEVITKLEHEYNVALFIRNQPLSLTYAGARLADMASKLLVNKRHIDNQLSDISNNTQGQFRFGMPIEHGRVLLPILLPYFKEKYPEIDFYLVLDRQYNLERQLLRGELDVIVGFDSFSFLEIVSFDLIWEKIYLMVPENILRSLFGDHCHEKIRQLEQGADIRDFADCPYLFIRRRGSIRKIIDKLFYNNNIKPNVALEGPDIEVLFRLSMQGMGITFYPQLLITPQIEDLARNAQTPVHLFPINDRCSDRLLVIGYHHDNYLPKFAIDFIEQTKKLCREKTLSQIKSHIKTV